MHEEKFYRSLYRIRRVEEEVARVYPSDKIKSPVHLSIGQESVAVGVCEALRPDDIVFITYRSHAGYLAKGGDLKAMIAEMYVHLVDVEHGVMGASAVVGTTIGNAIGYAYALKYQRKESIVISFFGDGGSDEGVFHESLNFAALKELPIIFVCENNGYAIHTAQKKRQKQTDLCQRARTYGMPAERIEDADVFTIYDKVSAAVKALRDGKQGPFFFECLTYRWKEHVGPGDDYHLGYRTKEEAKGWMENDQVKKVGAMLKSGDRIRIENEVEAEIKEAFEFAESSPFPEAAELYADVFKE
ncbi:MAG: thiamine pyrophosphate-dependent dehydrogenase E1 component subunit alpha [Chloroflexi bacterium]|nr:thiamine pyrophosphate-dependent dehydrogenase E1 component subunit alpha [Chloroflexota bacterium]